MDIIGISTKSLDKDNYVEIDIPYIKTDDK